MTWYSYLQVEAKSRLNSISALPREHPAWLTHASFETPQIGPPLQFPDKHADTKVLTHTHTDTSNSIYKLEFHLYRINHYTWIGWIWLTKGVDAKLVMFQCSLYKWTNTTEFFYQSKEEIKIEILWSNACINGNQVTVLKSTVDGVMIVLVVWCTALRTKSSTKPNKWLWSSERAKHLHGN